MPTGQFQVRLTIEELKHVPLPKGNFYVQASRHRGGSQLGCTPTVALSKNRAQFGSGFHFEARISISNGVLDPCEVHFSVHQETITRRLITTTLGVVSLNISQCAHSPSKRQLLLQECRSNCILAVHVSMKLVGGDPTFQLSKSSRQKSPSEELSPSHSRYEQEQLEHERLGGVIPAAIRATRPDPEEVVDVVLASVLGEGWLGQEEPDEVCGPEDESLTPTDGSLTPNVTAPPLVGHMSAPPIIPTSSTC
eukprot:TRINITY_DN4836_c0_g1_i13.p1 TRINITY_DN4836_c0_g1~~TRINITY_DN4836_c0_g1_i13.p1  ORF type:complete len:251 (-),score=48.46 TRINITY_DN4836_c0_g1_i13:1146-1898(-)